MSELISIIVPVYNESATIGQVIAQLLEIDLPAPREIIVINDGSHDSTRSVLERLEGSDAALVIVHADHNRGKGAAVRAGLARSRGTITAIQDADLELDPRQIASLVEPILRGDAEVVYGSRFLQGSNGMPAVTRIANRFLTGLTNLLFASSITDMETCYKIMRGDLARSLVLTADRFDIEPEITATLLQRGCRIVERPVTFTPRSRAAGKKIGWSDGLHAVRVLMRLRIRGIRLR